MTRLFTVQNLTAWYYCHAKLQRSNLICLFKLGGQLPLSAGAFERKKKGRRRRGGERSWQIKRQMPRMGFQSGLIYWSPWGLLAVVICFCLGLHDRRPSCFRCRSHRSSSTRRIISSSVSSLTQHLVMKTEGAPAIRPVLLCTSHLPPALRVYGFKEGEYGR